MRIAIALSGLGAGGAERVVAILARRWVERNWDVTVICFERYDADAYHALPPAVRIIRRPPPKVRSWVLASLDLAGRVLFLRRILRRENPDIVISFLTKINVLALLANLGAAQRLIICERNNPRRQDVRRIWHTLQNRLARRAILVLQTEASRSAFRPAAVAAARVIPNPIEPSLFAAEPSIRTIVATGRLVEQKGFDVLLDAFSRTAPFFPDWNLVIWGEGPLRGALERRRDALGLQRRVSLPGVSPKPGDWVRSGSVFALSSRYEGFPNVLVEAMSAGMAVVAFDCPFGPAEIVHHGEDGLLVRDGDVTLFAHRLEELMRDDALRARLGRAAMHSIQRFAVERVIAQWDAVLAAALTAHHEGDDFGSVATAAGEERTR
jgi:glycosyltransferase involved in cell wall biosynthesis